ncbi:MAG TPA: hypothetical protein VFM04_01075 [Candidatus Methylomirabilis sp.]|nr:hypothetical protein [Candidatus Methylomirabilis sp.]
MILWLHVLAAITWVGGMVFLLAVLAPLFHGTLPAREEIQIAYGAGRRYQFVVARAMEVLLVTGILAIVFRGGKGAGVSHGFWQILALKVLGFLVMAALQTWQRISMNRQLAPLLIAGGGGILGEQQWRAILSRMTQVTRWNLGIGVVMVLLGLLLRAR